MTALQRIGVAAVCGLVGVWTTTALGFWQLRRAAAKEVLQSQIAESAAAAPVAPDARALAEPATLVHRHLRLRGRWLPERVVYLDNRPRAGQAGFYVLMGLRPDAAGAADIVVNRGWTARSLDDRTRIQPYRTPDGPVDITGVALAEEPRLLDLATPATRALGGVWQNFDFAAYAKASGASPLPLVVRQDAEPQDVDGLLRDWPDRGGALQGQIDRHHGYAFQWFALAATLVALLLFQIFRVISHARPSPR